jgi:hypothetical protein
LSFANPRESFSTRSLAHPRWFGDFAERYARFYPTDRELLKASVIERIWKFHDCTIIINCSQVACRDEVWGCVKNGTACVSGNRERLPMTAPKNPGWNQTHKDIMGQKFQLGSVFSWMAMQRSKKATRNRQVARRASWNEREIAFREVTDQGAARFA